MNTVANSNRVVNPSRARDARDRAAQADPADLVRIVGTADGRFVTYLGDDPQPQPGGSQIYPFLRRFPQWEMVTRPARRPALDPTGPYPSLRLVREGRIADICIPTTSRHPRRGAVPGLPPVSAQTGLPPAWFLAECELGVSLRRGPAVLSKRLARLFSPYRYSLFMDAADLRICHSPALDGALWDGCGLVRRRRLRQHTAELLAHLPEAEREPAQRELARARRLEITVLHGGGQEKGDVLVVDAFPDVVGVDLDGQPLAAADADWLFPAGSSKREVWSTGAAFVGIKQVRHAQRRMRLDVQSLINLHPFLSPAQLLEWLAADSADFLAALTDGRQDALLGRLLQSDSPAALAQARSWWLLDYFISGGQARWFGGVVQALGRQRSRALDLALQGRQRFPVPGARAYILPAAVGGRSVPRGQIEVDLAWATAFVNDDDWCEHITRVLGGCDGDDAVWLLGFTDAVDTIDPQTAEVTQPRRLLVWRSPNQQGEYVVLTPTATSDAVNDWPRLDGALLPPRIDTVGDLQVGVLPETAPPAAQAAAQAEGYSIAAMTPAVHQAQANAGVLGLYVNVQMVCTALFGRVPRVLPAALEAVIDAQVKDGRDLTPVRLWCAQVVDQLARQGHAVPQALLPRVAGLTERTLAVSADHWLDRLLADAQVHLAQFRQELDALALRCCPPRLLFDVGQAWQGAAAQVYAAYSAALAGAFGRQTDGLTPHARALAATERALAQWPGQETALLAGLVAHCYLGGLASPTADAVLWQTAAQGATAAADGAQPEAAAGQTAEEPTAGMPARLLQALRALGLLGEPVWTDAGPVLYYADEPAAQPGLALTVNGVWFNYARLQGPHYRRMGDVPTAEAQRCKQVIAERAPGYVGRTLVVQAEGERLAVRTPQGVLFGLVAPGQTAAAELSEGALRVVVRHSRATRDGNVQLLVEPAA